MKTGGSVDYYKVQITRPLSGGQGYIAECLDIAEALKLTPIEFSIFKAVWRIAAARNGLEKEDNTALYDAEKAEFFSNVLLLQYKPVAVTPTEHRFSAMAVATKGLMPAAAPGQYQTMPPGH